MKTTLLLLASLPALLFAKEMIPTPPDFPVLGALEPYLWQEMIESGKKDAGLKDVNTQEVFQAIIATNEMKHFGGPVIGDLTDTSALIWLRTPQAAEVQVLVNDEPAFHQGWFSRPLTTGPQTDYTVQLPIKGLQASTRYYYQIEVDGEIALKTPASFVTAPARGERARFSVGFGGGARYNHVYENMWDTIAARKPLAFLFLGDNVYIDDGLNRSLQRLYYYRRQLRPEYQRLSASTAIYAIWDDHDFHNNDSAGGLDPFKPDYKVPVWNVFKENWPNPYYGGGPEQPGCWFDFQLGDVDFFMTDGRYYRDFKQGSMLGPVQKAWLKDKLKASTATFKVIASGTLWTETADKNGKDSWWGVPEEREEILGLLDEHQIGGVILISADRHRTDVYQIQRPKGYTLYEFETSKLTNNHTHGTRKDAIFSYNKGNYYGLLDFDLSKEDPTVTFRCVTIEDQDVYSITIPRSQLQSK
ncbi:MAG: alkaline phosphatase D [Verrucomicrobiales bacterium]|jgi:alkaline phosphatase D